MKMFLASFFNKMGQREDKNIGAKDKVESMKKTYLQ